MQNKNSKDRLYEDIGLLLLLLMLSITAVLMMLSQNIVVNIIYLIITMGILIVTYLVDCKFNPNFLTNLSA